jgi:hypothetical protein
MFLRRGQDETIKLIEDRIAAFSMVPAGAPPSLVPLAATELTGARPDHGEGIQVLHYEVGQKYEVRACAVFAGARL